MSGDFPYECERCGHGELSQTSNSGCSNCGSQGAIVVRRTTTTVPDDRDRCTWRNDHYGRCIERAGHAPIDNGCGVFYRHRYEMHGALGDLDVRESMSRGQVSAADLIDPLLSNAEYNTRKTGTLMDTEKAAKTDRPSMFCVSGIRSEQEWYESEWTITVKRSPGPGTMSIRPSDLPEDIRAGLIAWLQS